MIPEATIVLFGLSTHDVPLCTHTLVYDIVDHLLSCFDINVVSCQAPFEYMYDLRPPLAEYTVMLCVACTFDILYM